MRPIEVTHIAKSFGETQAISDVSFEVERGEIFGLLGPNEAGKTTYAGYLSDPPDVRVHPIPFWAM
jgi:ABC-2 type transport system ATP-binding protein